MNKHLTEIAFILDRSGSMESCQEAAVTGFNSFLVGQQTAPGDARLTLVLFDDQYELPYHAIPVAEATPLDSTTYVPRGSTALLDAIGRTIEDLGAELSARPESERPGQVIIAILTDGLENASQNYRLSDISERIAHQRDVYNWQFLFLGANQDAIATAAQMNIAAHDSASYDFDQIGVRSSNFALQKKVRAMRAKNSDPHFSPADEEVLRAPLSNLVEEEDRKQRDKEGEK